MQYTNFEQHITRKHGVVVEGWPLPHFRPPSDLSSREELKILITAWETGVAFFRKLSEDELDALFEARFQEALAITNQGAEPTAVATTPSSSDDSQAGATISPPVDSEAAAALSTTQPSSVGAVPTQASHAVPQPVSPPVAGPSTAVQASGQTVLAVSGSSLVTKRPRKQRSDKGKARGSRKKQHAEEPAAPVG